MNNTMRCILTLQALLDIQQWRLVSDIETTLHQNKAKAAEDIKIVKACYAGTICEAKAMYAMAIREAETNCSTSIMEAEGGHSTVVREVEATYVPCALDLQWAHGEAIRTLESEAIKEGGRACQSFLQACGAVLQACPTESLGILMYSIQLLTGNMSLTGLLMAAPQQTHSTRPTMVAHSARTKWPHSLPGCNMVLERSGDKPTSHLKGPPSEGKRKGIPWRAN